MLDASIIEIGHKNQATMLCTRKGRFSKKVYMPPIARMLPDGHAEVLEEAGGNSSDEDPPHDGADDVQMSVYEVNIATGLADIDDSQMSSAAFELVGAVQMPLHINLDEARVYLQSWPQTLCCHLSRRPLVARQKRAHELPLFGRWVRVRASAFSSLFHLQNAYRCSHGHLHSPHPR